ncbi:MAG: hypothetical protein NUW02_01220 [Candidatus Campbellbacteria bacterium]|nr:hypothetical protein [Candidatus Campbellbacteria bacterium]
MIRFIQDKGWEDVAKSAPTGRVVRNQNNELSGGVIKGLTVDTNRELLVVEFEDTGSNPPSLGTFEIPLSVTFSEEGEGSERHFKTKQGEMVLQIFVR